MTPMGDTRISKQIGVRIPNDMHAALTALAKAERRSVGFIVKDFIEEGLRREAKTKAAGKTKAPSKTTR